MNICIYENEKWQDLLPLVWFRPIFELRCGMLTFKQRIEEVYSKSVIHTISRDEKKPLKAELFINGNSLLYEKLPDEEGIFVSNNEVVGLRTQTPRQLQEALNYLQGKNKIEVNAKVIKYPWDLVSLTKETLIKDYELLGNSKPVTIAEGGLVEDGAYLNTDNGPIYVGAGARIRPTTLVDGPCYIGDKALVDCAKVRSAVTIGTGCRIGGEVEESIFSDWSNKHHEGFVGHSYIGEWVNIGALTTTSDLKNTYGTIKIKTFDKEIDTGTLKLGSIIGDHTKTGIGTLLTTGCMIGSFANIYGGGIFDKYIPAFSWGTKEKLVEYDLEKAIKVAERVMKRRGITLTPEYEANIRKAFELTKKERAGK